MKTPPLFLAAALLIGILFAPDSARPARTLAALPRIQNPSSLLTPEPPSTFSNDDERTLASMPLKTKLGQMLMIGFKGHHMRDGLGEMIKAVRPGAIVFFGRNIKTARQVVDLNAASQNLAKEISGLPLLIAADQEGGNVVRIKTTYPLPSALAIGLTDNSDLAQRAGLATGQLMKTLGFNMNLAPVLDVASNRHSKFLGTRAYSGDPDVVTKMGLSFGQGLDTSGVMPTAKHFPGHGGLDGDSHLGFTESSADKDLLMKFDLAPFVNLAAHAPSPWAIMLAHVAYPALDPSRVPATFSKPIVTGLLREKMGFKGLVLTDDIEMAGAAAIKDVNERALRAVEAGADIIMIAWNKRMQKSIAAALVKAIDSGRLSEARIDESVRRILAAKRQFANLPSTTAKVTNEKLKFAIRNEAFKDIAAATVVARLARKSSLSNRKFQEFVADKPVIVFSANPNFLSQFKEVASEERAVQTYNLNSATNSDSSNPLRIERVMRSNPTAVGVFYVSGRTVAKIASRLSADVTSRMLLITVETPSLISNFSSFKEVADIYVRHPQLGKLIAEHYFVQEEIREPAVSGRFTQDPAESSQSEGR